MVDCSWESVVELEYNSKLTVHDMGAISVDTVMKNSLLKKTMDNITVVMIVFENFYRMVNLIYNIFLIKFKIYKLLFYFFGK